ncbi:unnamed protein product [Linum trigynum]|uniref:RNase H type-1 domain-containing protein n=1 Tax=Linum trigynum TaxID=586398 RepID=A0AAV2CK88_9ROSI
MIVVKLVKGSFEAKEESLAKLAGDIQNLLAQLEEWNLEHIKREENHHVDALSKLFTAMDFNEERHVTITKEGQEVEVMEMSDVDWRSPIIRFLEKSELPNNQKEVSSFKQKVVGFTMIQGSSTSTPKEFT